MADALTARQQEILNFISASINERGFPPTLREIGEHFQIRSTNGVNDHLKALEKKGVLRREDLKSRAMRPVSQPNEGAEIIPLRRNGVNGTNVEFLADDSEMISIPVLGKVAAGQPILAVEQATDTVKIDRVLIGGHKEVFGLRIVGESMIEDGIFDGDYVFVKKTASARDGEIVVAMIEGEATVKRYFPEGDRIRFQPANCNMAPIIVRKADFKSVDIIGIVVGIYRKL
ncbi:MAG TPA: transcriptional repressor LexA [Kofleriaceae bacterium]|nr:transcriptional repressor LexA [Kofleriaceae bacterium]